MRYHITPDGPDECHAEHGQCPFARAGGAHFEKFEEAQRVYEEQMSAEHGLLSSARAHKNFPNPSIRTAGISNAHVRRSMSVIRDFDKLSTTSRRSGFLAVMDTRRSTVSSGMDTVRAFD